MTPRPTGALPGTDLGDEFLLYDREADCVHVLNGTAREIFLLFDGTRSIEQVATVFAERFGLEPEQARSDVEDTMARLRELGVIAD